MVRNPPHPAVVAARLEAEMPKVKAGLFRSIADAYDPPAKVQETPARYSRKRRNLESRA